MVDMKKITLQRFVHDKVTFGKLSLDWCKHPDIYTIELPWNDNKKSISCIPQGLYNLIPYNSKKYPNVFKLLNVPGRSDILIHVGNYACEVTVGNGTFQTDTEGCILVGFGIEEGIPMITKSRAAMDFLRKAIGKDNCSIEVKD